MKVILINSTGFWSMGWATAPASQQDVISSLQRAGIGVQIYNIRHKIQLDELLESLKFEPCLIWPNAYHVYTDQRQKNKVWLADVIKSKGLPMIGNSAEALKKVFAKNECQRLLEQHKVPIPGFAEIHKEMLDQIGSVLTDRQLTFPLFVKPNALSSSKGITQDCVTHTKADLIKQITLLGETFGYPVMVEEFLPFQDITVAVYMTPIEPVILATWYDTDIYDNPGAALDHSVRLRDWNDGKWLRLVTEPTTLAQIKSVVIQACDAVGIHEFTRIDCRFDRNGVLKVFDINGLPGLELPFSTSVWQMIVKMNDEQQTYAYDTLIALIIYSAACRYQMSIPTRIIQLAETFLGREQAKVA